MFHIKYIHTVMNINNVMFLFQKTKHLGHKDLM